MIRALRQCRHAGCPELVRGSGYCPKHVEQHRRDPVQSLRDLDRKKTPEDRAFYSGARWTAASKLHRQREPLCRQCRAGGRVVPATLVHHNPPREELLRRGIDPYDDQYLESLCERCHLKELRAKR